MNEFLAFSTKLLLTTNIWIVIYTSLIDYLNFKFPPIIKEAYYRPEGVFPEHFEIPLYLSLTLLFVLLIKYLLPAFNAGYTYIEKVPYLRFGFFMILLALFISKLGSFPLAGNPEPFTSNFGQTIYFAAWIFYLLIFGVFILELFLLTRIVKNSKKKLFIIFIGVITFIALVTFQPGFPITSINYAQFIGPAWEIAHGKTIFTEVPSRYGFLSILTMVIFSKLKLFNLLDLPIFIWSLYLIQYFLFFYLTYKISRSLPLALVGLSSVLTIDYFSYIQSPQSGPMRWLPVILVIFLFYHIRKINSKLLLFFTAALSLWSIDSGVAIIFGYLTTLLFLFFKKTITFIKLFKTTILFSLNLGIILISINIFHKLLGMNSINFFQLFHSLRSFAISGNSMIPIDLRSYFWLTVLIYFASIIYYFKNTKNINHNQQETRYKQYSNIKKSKFKLFDKLEFGSWNLFGKLGSWDLEFEKVLLLFSANLMLFAATYYVGRSAPDYLFKISIIPLFTFFLLIGLIYKNATTVKLRILTLTLLFLLLVVFPSFQRKEYLTEAFWQNYKVFKQGNIFKPRIYNKLETAYRKEADLIKKTIKEERIILISSDDTYLLYLTEKSSLINANPQNDLILTTTDMDLALSSLDKSCPKTIFVDCTLFNRCPDYEHILTGYPPLEPSILKVVEKKCNATFEPTLCTNKLCIAGKKK